MMTTRGVRVRVLGPLEAAVADEAIDLGTPKQRLLLGLLLLAGGQPVAMDRIVDCLWRDDPPARAEASVHAYISNLRRVLEPRRAPREPSVLLLSATGGYRLRVDLIEIDARRFAALADEAAVKLRAGDAAAARAASSEALAFWRGQPFADAGDNPFFLAERARLDALRWVALENRAEAMLALGMHDAVVVDLVHAVAEMPLRERLRVLLATALYRAGRQADALMVVRHGVAMLREEVGLDPVPELRALEEDLLRHAEYLRPPAREVTQATTSAVSLEPISTAATGAARPAILVGRDREMELLRSAARAAEAGSGRPVIVSGEPGMGKTWLVRAMSEELAARCWLTGWGRCPDASDAPGLWPLRHALTSLTASAGHDAAQWARMQADRLGPLYDAVTAPSASGSQQPARAGVGGRAGVDQGQAAVLTAEPSDFLMSMALADLLRRLTQRYPALLVVDDLQWADVGTLRVLRHLVSSMSDLAVLLVAVQREPSCATRPDLVALREDIVRTPGGTTIPLRGLDSAAVQSLMAAHDRTKPTLEAADQVAARTGGNPFFVLQLGADGGVLPSAVRDAVRGRLVGLATQVRHALDVLAVAGEEADIDLLATVTGLPQGDMLAAVRQAFAVGLVEQGTRPGSLRLAHDLVRETIYTDLDPVTRASLHNALGAVLASRWGSDPEHLPAIAWHLKEGVMAGDPAEAFRASCRAAYAAERGRRVDEAVERWTWAAELLPLAAASPEARYQVSAGLGTAQSLAGAVDSARRTLLAAAYLARQGADWSSVADCLTHTEGFTLWPWHYGRVDAEVVALLNEAAAVLEGEDERRAALVYARLAVELYYTDDEQRCDQLSMRGVELARRSGDPRSLAIALNDRYLALYRADRVADQLATAKELAALAGAADVVPGEVEAVAAVMAGLAGQTLGLADAAAQWIARAERLASTGRFPFLAVQLRWADMTRLLLAGHLEAAEDSWAAAREFHARVGAYAAEDTALIALAGLRLEQGRAGELQAELRAVFEEGDRRAVPFGEILVLGLLDRGETEDASKLAARIGAMPVPLDWTWLSCMCARAHARARLNDAAACRALYEHLRNYSGQVAQTGQIPPAWGSVDFFLGELAGAAGWSWDAEKHLRIAISVNETFGARRWLARARSALADIRGRH